jgi:hypothetical protein
MNTDMYSLYHWALDEELKAHNLAAKHLREDAIQYQAREQAFKELAKRIVNNPNQRPHIKVMGDDF